MNSNQNAATGVHLPTAFWVIIAFLAILAVYHLVTRG